MVTLKDESYTLEEIQDYMNREGFINLSCSSPNISSYITNEIDQNTDFFEKGIETTKSLHLTSITHADGSELKKDLQEKIWLRVINNQLENNNNLENDDFKIK